jgi:hypothetical protein
MPVYDDAGQVYGGSIEPIDPSRPSLPTPCKLLLSFLIHTEHGDVHAESGAAYAADFGGLPNGTGCGFCGGFLHAPGRVAGFGFVFTVRPTDPTTLGH